MRKEMKTAKYYKNIIYWLECPYCKKEHNEEFVEEIFECKHCGKEFKTEREYWKVFSM